MDNGQVFLDYIPLLTWIAIRNGAYLKIYSRHMHVCYELKGKSGWNYYYYSDSDSIKNDKVK